MVDLILKPNFDVHLVGTTIIARPRFGGFVMLTYDMRHGCLECCTFLAGLKNNGREPWQNDTHQHESQVDIDKSKAAKFQMWYTL
eukprot:2515923-Amphidinium_carterae.1